MVRSSQRFTRAHPCPICGGHPYLRQGTGTRCWGFLSDDSMWSHCTREEYAGALVQKPGSDTFAHPMQGPCKCGVQHGPSESPYTNGVVRYSVTKPTGLTLNQLASAKGLHLDVLTAWGVHEVVTEGVTKVAMPYPGVDGSPTKSTRYRIALEGDRFRWEKDSLPILYGMQMLPDIKQMGKLIFVEGETDTLTGWMWETPVLGIPGKGVWNPEWAPVADGVQPYAWVEPRAKDFAIRIAESLPNLRIIVPPSGIKDLNHAHVMGLNVRDLADELMAKAVTLEQFLADEDVDLLDRIRPVLESPHPIALLREAMSVSYGGDINKPLAVYFALTSRLVKIRRGATPVHLILIGPSSSGKNYVINTATELMPQIKTPKRGDEEYSYGGWFQIAAGSPRALIYYQGPTEHRAVVFGEADSIPGLGSSGPGGRLDASEDNPAASAIRNLLNENEISYSVPVQQKDGRYRTEEVHLPGPTMLVTTAVRRLGTQLMTRLFVLEISETDEQIRAALDKITQIHNLEELPDPPDSLIAYQEYLQKKSPWDVHIPFLNLIRAGLPDTKLDTRILRDYQKVISYIKSIAVYQHFLRDTDKLGRIIADVDDYAIAHRLLNPMFEEVTTGVTEAVTNVVAAVHDLKREDNDRKVNYSMIERKLSIHRGQIMREVEKAIAKGWLIDNETKPRSPRDIILGEPLPNNEGLPEPESIREAMCHAVTPFTNSEGEEVLYTG